MDADVTLSSAPHIFHLYITTIVETICHYMRRCRTNRSLDLVFFSFIFFTECREQNDTDYLL